MPNALPSEIQARRTPTGVWFRLPTRRDSRFSLAGTGLIVIGVLLPMAVAEGKFDSLMLHIVAFGAVGAAGAWLGLYGWWLCAGCDEIELSGSLLIRRMRIGRFAFPRGRSLDSLRQIEAVKIRESGLGLLRAQFLSGKPFVLSYGYPPEWLLPLAKVLSHHCALHLPVGGNLHAAADMGNRVLAHAPPPPVVPVVALVESLQPGDYVDRVQRPPGCRSVFRNTPEGLRFEVPRRGLWHSNPDFLLLFAFGWAGIISVVTAGILKAKLTGGESAPPMPLLLWLLLLTPFWIITTSLLAAVFWNASRRVVLELNANWLVLEVTDLLGSRRQVWARSNLTDFRVHSYCGTTRRTRLVVQTNALLPTTLLTFWNVGECNRAELEWMATLLRNALRRDIGSAIGLGESPFAH